MPDTARTRALRKQPTWAEKLMWRWLRDRRFSGYKFRRQHPVGIYVLDFFCEEARLNVELDGSQHGFPDQRKHDLAREKYLQSLSIKTLRFWNSWLRREVESIRETIFRELQARAPHPLPDYTRPMAADGKRGQKNARPHPDPLPQGEGTASARLVKTPKRLSPSPPLGCSMQRPLDHP